MQKALLTLITLGFGLVVSVACAIAVGVVP